MCVTNNCFDTSYTIGDPFSKKAVVCNEKEREQSNIITKQTKKANPIKKTDNTILWDSCILFQNGGKYIILLSLC